MTTNHCLKPVFCQILTYRRQKPSLSHTHHNDSFTARHTKVKSSNLSPPTNPCPHPPHSHHRTRHSRSHRPHLWAGGSSPGPFPSCTCCQRTCGRLGSAWGSHEARQECWLCVRQSLSTWNGKSVQMVTKSSAMPVFAMLCYISRTELSSDLVNHNVQKCVWLKPTAVTQQPVSSKLLPLYWTLLPFTFCTEERGPHSSW